MMESAGTQIKIVAPFDFPFEEFGKIKNVKRPRKTKGNENKPDIMNIVTAFDIETTRIDELNQSVMYTWQWHFSDPLNICVIGRTWPDFLGFVELLKFFMPAGTTLIIFDHNLSYEFQFIRAFYPFTNDEVKAVKSRKVLSCTMYNVFEFRDTLLHTNMSLKEFLKKMNVEHQKIDGAAFDYEKKRYSWTPLTDLEMQYITHDVIGLCEAIEQEMKMDNDTLFSLPRTSTGYVRRDAKKVLYYESHFGRIPEMLPDWHTYSLLREAFRGGDCHCNRFIAGDILHNVHSYDRSSSYPDVLCNCDFPMTQFKPVENPDEHVIAEKINEHKALIMRVKLKCVHLRDRYWPDPYLSFDKCRNVVQAKIDNGRILKAYELETTVTDIDFQIILEQYDCEITIADCMESNYGPLPKKFITLITDYYKLKTKLKQDKNDPKFDPFQEMLYNKLKNKLNALYGMCAQDPVKENILYNDGAWDVDDKPRKELLEKYNESAFLPYQWGVFCTSWARMRLFEGIKIAGPYNFVYADTDSVKFINDADFSKFNRRAIRWSKQSGAAGLDPKGNMHYMGVFEQEHDYARFRTWGAKKYAYQYEEGGPTEATISGVVKAAEYDEKGEPTKLSGGLELDKHGGLEAFQEGFVFREAGGLAPIYNDDNYGTYTIDGHEIEITSNICLVPSTYTVSLGKDYKQLLTDEDMETLKRLGLPGWQEE